MNSAQKTSILKKVIALCQRYSIIIPEEGKLSPGGVTCYHYGAIGSLFRRNIQQRWWGSMLKENNIFAVDNTSLNQMKDSDERTDYDSGAVKSFSLDKSKDFSVVSSMVNGKLPFGYIHEELVIQTETRNNDVNKDFFLFNTAEQRHMVLDFVMARKDMTRMLDYWQLQRLRWWKQYCNVPSRFHIGDQVEGGDEKHIMYEFPWGPECIESLSCNTPTNNSNSNTLESGSGQAVTDAGHLRSTAILERGMLAYLIDAYKERSVCGDSHPVLHLHPNLAAYTVAVANTCSPSHLSVADEVVNHLAKCMREQGLQVLVTSLQATGLTDYTRYDCMGVPWVVTVDDDSLQNGVVTVRSRHTTLQEKVALNSVASKLHMYASAS